MRASAASDPHKQHRQQATAKQRYLVRSGFPTRWCYTLSDSFEHFSILTVLAADKVSRADLHQQLVTLHFGLYTSDEQPETVCKILRNQDRVEGASLIFEAIPWRDQARKILDINALIGEMPAIMKDESFTSAEFAL
jgi:hypothetical protein